MKTEARLPIAILSPMVVPRREAVNRLKELVEEDNFEHPIVVLLTTKEEWEEHKLQAPYILDAPDIPEILQVRCGNTRIQVLKDRGYRAVECIVTDDLDTAAELCREQNRWHKQKYGRALE